MEVGFMLYFFVVFGLGGLLLLALLVYSVREFLVRKDRPAWSARTHRSKAIFVTAVVVTFCLTAVPLQMI